MRKIAIGLTGTVNSYNAFAYCENGPVNRRDKTGHVWKDFFNKINSILAYSFNIKFGGKDSWYKSSVWSNNFDQFLTSSYSESIYEEGSKVMERDEEINAGMIALLSSVVVNIWLNALQISSSNKKRYNAVWGDNGIDPKNKQEYFLFEVSKFKLLNGLYVYSLKNNVGREIEI